MTKNEPVTMKTASFYLRMLIASSFIHWGLSLLPRGTKGRLELAAASMIFHEGLKNV